MLISHMTHQIPVSRAPVSNQKVRFLPIYIYVYIYIYETTIFHLTIKKFHSSPNEFLLSVKVNQEDFTLIIWILKSPWFTLKNERMKEYEYTYS